jgi:hypothetical protein
MAMPRQLARGLQARRQSRRRSRHSEPRPIVELMPAICITDLRNAIPRNYGTNIYSNPFRYPKVLHMRLSNHSIEIIDHHDRSQRFPIAWIPTYFGAHRAIFVCNNCRCGAIRLFARHGTYACRHCHRLAYASQQRDRNGRKRLAACKLRLKLGGQPDITEPMPPRPKWTRQKTHQHIRNEIQALETKAKTQRFKRPLNSQLFAYHVS